MAEFVVGVADQHGIHRVCRQMWFFLIPNDNVDSVLPPYQRPGPQEKQRQLAKIHRKNLTSFANGRRELEREITGARAHVRHGVPFLQVQRQKDVGWPLPLVALQLNSIKLMERIYERVQR